MEEKKMLKISADRFDELKALREDVLSAEVEIRRQLVHISELGQKIFKLLGSVEDPEEEEY